jgi:hypothetical protein
MHSDQGAMHAGPSSYDTNDSMAQRPGIRSNLKGQELLVDGIADRMEII